MKVMLTRSVPVQVCAPALLLAALLCGCNNSRTPISNSTSTSAVAAIVNNNTISQDDFITSLESYIPNQQTGPFNVPAGKVVMLQLIQENLLEGLAAQENVAPTQQQIDDRYNDMKLLHDAQTVKPMELELADSNLTVDQFKRLRLEPEVAQFNLLTQGQTVSDADITTFYNQNKAQRFTKSDRAHIKRIAFATQAQAQAVYDQINTGGRMFEDFIDQSAVKSPPNADLPNWIPTDPTKTPKLAVLCNAILATEVGKTSKPFNFQGGWWLVKVIDREPTEVLPEPVVHHLIQWLLLGQKSDANRLQQVQQALRSYQSQAKIVINDPSYAAIADNLKASAAAPAPQPGGMPTQ